MVQDLGLIVHGFYGFYVFIFLYIFSFFLVSGFWSTVECSL